MAVQARRDTILKKVQQGDDLKPGNVWAITFKGIVVQVPKDVFKKNSDKFKAGPFYHWGMAHSYIKEISTLKEIICNL